MDNTGPSPTIQGNPDVPFLLSKSAVFQSLNSVPTPAEASCTHNLLTLAESELHQLDFDIVILLAKRTQIIKQIANYKTILSPHKSLPAELISKIFSLIITEPYAVFPLKYGKQDARLRITQVCSRWRRIAFDTPDLWDFQFSHPYPESCVDLGAFWWSQHSGSKLRISAMYRRRSNPISNLGQPLIEKLILPFSGRLREIRVSVSHRTLGNFLSAPPGSFGNLETVNLWIDCRNSEWLSEGSTASMTAPRLRSVSLAVASESWFCPTLPWAQLTQLTLTTRIPPDACFILLAKCVSLIHCELSCIEEDFAPITELGPLPDFPLHLPLLNSFAVHFQPGNFSPLLNRLCLPHLSEFRIMIDIFHHENHWTRDCGAFFQSAEESLRQVEIRALAGDEDPVNPLDEGILYNFPNLTSFIAPYYHPLKSSTLDKIARGRLLPKVESLQFHTDNAVDVVNLLTDRRRNASSTSIGAVSPIKKIQVNCGKMTPGDREQLNAFRSEGVLIDYFVLYDDPHTMSGDLNDSVSN